MERSTGHVTDTPTFPPRPIYLPAVLQVGGHAPCFGILASITEQGLAFDFHFGPLQAQWVGSKAILDFSLLGQHYAITALFVHAQDRRALLSLREAPPSVLSALAAATRQHMPPLAASLAILQRQHACHARFMEGMRAVIDTFYQQLPEAIVRFGDQALSLSARAGLNELDTLLNGQRDQIVRQFCLAYPMYPEQRASYAGARKVEASMDLVDTGQVDDWIRRTTVARRIDDALAPLPHTFNRHYNALLKNDYAEVAHPYRLESVLNVLADLITPLGMDADIRLLCYKTLGQAFETQAPTLYPALIRVLGVEPDDAHTPAAGTDLAAWLRAAARPSEAAGENVAAMPPPSPARIGEWSALLEHLPPALDTTAVADTGGPPPDIPDLSAYERILSRFLPPIGRTSPPAEATRTADSRSRALDVLSALDATALDNLRAQLQQPPPIEPGPERLAETSQVRELLQQAQGLALQYMLNGLTYEARPEHPIWALLNLIDTFHFGADDHGRLLDPARYRAAALAMQWLLAQDQTDDALQQVNTLLAGLVTGLQGERHARRAAQIELLGLDPNQEPAGWCIVRRGDDAIPHEILGTFGDRHVLLNRAATEITEIPNDTFAANIDAGVIEETGSYDRSFLARSAGAALTAGLGAVHAYTWKDPSSGCLKRSALIDELERRLQHPVLDPPTFCALVEIPSMRPSLSPLPGDELSVLQTRSGELLLGMLEAHEHCGRLSDVAFMVVFAPQDPQRVSDRLTHIKGELENLHPSWKMIGAVVPLVAPGEADPSPSSVLRRANQACAGIRHQAGLELSGLGAIVPIAAPPVALPLASLYLRCQKIQPCVGDAPAHYEILLGLDDNLSPQQSTQSFVLMAEQTGRIHELDAWVLRSALDWMERNASLTAKLSGLSINLSGACISQQEHVDTLAGLLSARPELASRVILEVTETSAIDNLNVAARAEEAGLPHRAGRLWQRLQLLWLSPAAAARLPEDRRHLHPQHSHRSHRSGIDGVHGRRCACTRPQGDRGIRR